MLLYDAVVIGGGPAGLSAAIYLARYNRSVTIIDKENGRWKTHEINENYFGFPDGIPTIKLRDLGLKQAKHYGAEYIHDYVSKVEKKDGEFVISAKDHTLLGKTVLFATGVKDLFPRFEHWDDYVGRSLFWCITCDGYKTRNKKIIVIGQDDDAVISALQFLNFTKDITFVSDCEKNCHVISQKYLDELKKRSISFYDGIIKTVEGERGMCESLSLDDGTILHAEMLISQRGAVPNTELAVSLGVLTDKKGYLETDTDQKTNVPGVYAAGDVTRMFSHQIVSAAYEGAAAAEAINYDLYEPFQKY